MLKSFFFFYIYYYCSKGRRCSNRCRPLIIIFRCFLLASQRLDDLIELQLSLLLLVSHAVQLCGVHVPKRLLVPRILVFYSVDQHFFHVVHGDFIVNLVRVRSGLAEPVVQFRIGRQVLRQNPGILAYGRVKRPLRVYCENQTRGDDCRQPHDALNQIGKKNNFRTQLDGNDFEAPRAGRGGANMETYFHGDTADPPHLCTPPMFVWSANTDRYCATRLYLIVDFFLNFYRNKNENTFYVANRIPVYRTRCPRNPRIGRWPLKPLELGSCCTIMLM